MCGGASQSQKNISQEQQQQFQEQQQQYTQLQQQYNQIYGEDQGILSNLTANLQPVINAGPSQKGYSDGELNALNTQATTGTAQGYAQAQQALGENEAASGGSAYIPSGGQAQLAGELASTAAQSNAAQKTGILQADYAQGNQNYQTALQGEEGVAGLLNPTSYSGAAISSANATTAAGTSAADEANAITQQNNSVWTGILSGLSGIAGQAAGGLAGGWAKNNL